MTRSRSASLILVPSTSSLYAFFSSATAFSALLIAARIGARSSHAPFEALREASGMSSSLLLLLALALWLLRNGLPLVEGMLEVLATDLAEGRGAGFGADVSSMTVGSPCEP